MIRFRYFKIIFFISRIMLIYGILLFFKPVLPSNLYQAILYRVNIFSARAIRLKIFQFKGLFIKLGQYISVIRYLFSTEFGKEFEEFQDSIDPIPYEQIRQRFLIDFQKTPEEIFQSFEKVPIAAASIGQVHIAYTFLGQKIAVKIIYPYIEDLVKIDFKLIRLIMKLVHFFFPVYDPKLVFKEFSSMVSKELDYNQERKNLEKIEKQFIEKKNEYIFPKVFEKYSSKNILTLEYIEGIKINNFEEIKKRFIDLEHVAERLIKAYCHMIFIHNEFHADPHPGNILIVGQGNHFKIAFLDFGSIKLFNQDFRKYSSEFLNAFFNQNILDLIRVMKKMKFIPKIQNYDLLESTIQFFLDRINELNISENQFKDIQFFLQDIRSIKNLDVEFKSLIRLFEIPADYIYLWRVSALVFSLSSKLNTRINAFQIAYPFIQNYLDQIKKDEYKSIQKKLSKVLLPISQIPTELLMTLKIINQDRFKMQVIGLEVNKIHYIGIHFIYLFATFGFSLFAFLFFKENLFLLMKIFIGISTLFFAKFLISIVKRS